LCANAKSLASNNPSLIDCGDIINPDYPFWGVLITGYFHFNAFGWRMQGQDA